MRRVWKSDLTRTKPKTLIPDFPNLTRVTHTRTPLQGPLNIASLIGLFADKHPESEELRGKASLLRDELVGSCDDAGKVVRVLEEKGETFFRTYSNGSAFVELMKQLSSWPSVALQVCLCLCYVWFLRKRGKRRESSKS